VRFPEADSEMRIHVQTMKEMPPALTSKGVEKAGQGWDITKQEGYFMECQAFA
jgi:hypothetical protein